MQLLVVLCLVPFAALANWAAVEAWHHGSLFGRLRTEMEARRGFLGRLLSCPYCLSHWTGACLAAAAHLAALDWSSPCWPVLFAFPIIWLAVVRLSNLGNDLAHGRCRTPRFRLDAGALEELGRLAEKPGEGKEPADG